MSEEREFICTCVHCGRHRPPCNFIPIAYLSGTIINEDGTTTTIGGQLCWDCDKWLREGRPPRTTPIEEKV